MVDRNHPTRITRSRARRATLALLIAALLFPAALAGAATNAPDEELQKIQQLVQDRDLAGARA
jgi:type IV secretory pathway VirB2 component (pilin)